MSITLRYHVIDGCHRSGSRLSERPLLLTCGYRGRELQGRRGQERLACPRCCQDLYTRPARTYAEMEGPAQPARAMSPPTTAPGRRRLSLIRLAGGLLGSVGLMLTRSGGRGS